jgi:hypothetical protein
MTGVDVEGSLTSRKHDAYDKPKLERLGTFRELTQCGDISLIDLWLGGRGDDRCPLTGSSFHPWRR